MLSMFKVITTLGFLDLFEKFEPMNFVRNLDVMGAGMLGIFIVIGILIFFIYILNALTNRKKGKKKNKNSEK